MRTPSVMIKMCTSAGREPAASYRVPAASATIFTALKAPKQAYRHTSVLPNNHFNVLHMLLLFGLFVGTATATLQLQQSESQASAVVAVAVAAKPATPTAPSATSFHPADTENLSVRAILSEGSALQLHVRWKITPEAEGKSFDVRITPDPNADRCTSRKPCIEYGLTPNTSELVLPRDTMTMLEYRECFIELGCTYDVRVESINRAFVRNITFRVPDCVEGECLCAHGERLPTIRVNYNIEPLDLRLIWNISSSYRLPFGVSIEKLAISVGRQNNPSLKWGGPYETLFDLSVPFVHATAAALLNGSVVNFPHGETIVRHTMVAGSRYSVRMAVIDNGGCRGPTGNITFTTPAPSVATTEHHQAEQDDSSYMWLFVALVVVTVVLLVAVPLLVHLVRNARQAKVISNWRGVYHNVQAITSSGMQHLDMQENFLYVNKEILDARNRGDADMLEVPHSNVLVGQEIGKGAFGRVFLARAKNICGRPGFQLVAVKQLKKRPTAEELEEFISEIAMMKTVSRHENVVALLGCCTIQQPLQMIMEFVGCGDLLQYLRQVRAKHEARSAQRSSAGRPFQLRCNNSHSSSGGGASGGSGGSGVFLPGHSRMQHSTSVSSDVFGETIDVQQQQQRRLNHSHNLRHNQQQQSQFGRYLELVHRTSSTSSTSDSTYVTEADTFPAVRPSVTETMYTMLSQGIGGGGGKGAVGAATSDGSASSLEYVLDHNELHNFATQIARGMRHLHEHQITHRDLAARNILIDENKTLKISDFGLSRSGIYVNTRNKKVPLRWLSLEAMRDHLYSAKSDVWAFGILLWEIGTLGGFPYPTVSNHELLAYLVDGNRLERPENCSEHLYQLMLACWADGPDDRPAFADIVQHLDPGQGARHNTVYVDFNELRKDYTFPPTREQVLLMGGTPATTVVTTQPLQMHTTAGGAGGGVGGGGAAGGRRESGSSRLLMGLRLPTRRRSSDVEHEGKSS